MREPWIRVHGGLFDKPVVTRLCEATGIKEHEAIGVLVTFWSGVAKDATNGRIGQYPDAQLEKWAKWRRRKGTFSAWVRTEHMDADGRVPEWDQYAGRLEVIRARDRDRKSAGIPAESQRNGGGIPENFQRNSTPTRGDVDVDVDGTVSSPSAGAEETAGRNMLLESVAPTRRRGLEATIAMWEKGADLPAGIGVPTVAQVDIACRECIASVEPAQVSVAVLRGFLVKLMRPGERGTRNAAVSLTDALLRPEGAA
jgi:hypothetical protein